MVEFEALLDAWNRNDTNAVRSLCVSGFDPYAEENFVHVNFLLTTQNGTGRGVLQRNADGRFAFFPHGSLSWFPPGYVHGRVYFYAKENGTWKFTGNTEFYVD